MSSRSNHLKLTALQKQMEAAAEAMDFEEATRLRDETGASRAKHHWATLGSRHRGP